MEKICKCCKIIKNISCFHKRIDSKDGYKNKCKICLKKYKKQYYNKNKCVIKEKNKQLYIENKEKIKDRVGKYRLNNKEKIKESNNKWYHNNKNNIKEYNFKNKEKIKLRQKKYKTENKERIKLLTKEYRIKNKNKYKEYRKKYTLSDNCKISHLLRTSICRKLKLCNSKKNLSSNELLGCSIKFFREYLESKFTKGMTWENRGRNGWHIDHIMPCASFDLSDLEQQKICFHYTNLQPLWATTEIALKYGEDITYLGNINKSNKLL